MKNAILSKGIAVRALACVLAIAMLAGCIVITASAAGEVAISSDSVTTVILAESYSSFEHGSQNVMYVEEKLGPAYFDGVRAGDKIHIEVNVPKDGTYQWCMYFGWNGGSRHGSYALLVDGEEKSTLTNQEVAVDWRTWVNSTVSTVELSKGKHTLTVESKADGPNLYAIKLAPEDVVLDIPEGNASLVNGDTNTPLEIKDTFAVQFNILMPFDSISVGCPSYSNNIGSFRMDLYKWDSNYDKTVKGKVVLTADHINFNDNASLALKSNSQIDAGEYLLVMTNISDDKSDQIGIWTNPASPANVRCYQGGVEIGNAPRASIHYYGETDQPLGKLSANKSDVPQFDEVTEDLTDYSQHNLPDTSLYLKSDVMPDTWVFTDGLGRVSLTNADVGDPRDGKTLAMFYWTWHTTLGGLRDTLNIQEFIDSQTAAGIKYEEYIHDFNYSKWPHPTETQYFWNEPIYGYYRTDDMWVLRRQAEMLANAGVDVIFADNTNAAQTWPSGYKKVLKSWSGAQIDGVEAPKVSFMLPFWAGADTKSQLNELYIDIFRTGKYRSLWYYLDGKPMLMAHASSLSDSILDKQIKEFFTFRAGQPLYFPKKTRLGEWGWLSTARQAVYYGTQENLDANRPEQVTVGVAQNATYASMELTAMNGKKIMGRSYTSKYQDRYDKEGRDASLYGYNFSEQFDYALGIDPEVIFVTGWNEWVASRYDTWGGVANAFPDTFNDEFSRDLEPSRGALRDHYYYLLVNYVRKYKGVRAIPAPTAQKTIDISAGQSQWADVGPYYATYIGNTGDRDAAGYKTHAYSDYSGRNDIIGAQVARDGSYLYFNVECAKDITPYTDNLWMNLYIDVDAENAGWESFDYVVNKTKPTADAAVLERFTGDGYASEKTADVEYKVDGRYMTVKIAKSALGIEGGDYAVNFLWTDNVHDEADTGADSDGKLIYSAFSGDILDFYTSGDVAPGARFKYSYVVSGDPATIPPTVGDTPDCELDTKAPESDTAAPEVDTTAAEPQDSAEASTAYATDAPAEESSDEDTMADAPADAPADAASEGCKSMLGTATAVSALALICAAGVIIKKKKED